MNYDEKLCPSCGKIATADFVDNGVGMERCGPWYCESCGWVEPKVEELFS